MDWFEKRDKQQDAYDTALSALTDMVLQQLAVRRFLIVTKPKVDAERWVTRQMLHEEYSEMDHELTAKLLGTARFRVLA